jgi:hypothetical protein
MLQVRNRYYEIPTRKKNYDALGEFHTDIHNDYILFFSFFPPPLLIIGRAPVPHYTRTHNIMLAEGATALTS